jgi:hypothetical protein
VIHVIQVSGQAYKAAWLGVIVVLVAGWASYGIAHHPAKGWLITMIVVTGFLCGGVAALLRPGAEGGAHSPVDPATGATRVSK